MLCKPFSMAKIETTDQHFERRLPCIGTLWFIWKIVLNNDDKKITDTEQSLLSLPNQVQSELKPVGESSADPLCLVFTRTSTNAA